MKASAYNYILYSGGYGYWYNALTDFYFRLTEGVSRKVESLLPDLETLEENAKPIYETLVGKGFVVTDECDEIALIRQKHIEAVNRKDYFMVVMPTLNCNYRCWYCIQDHIPSVMKQDTIEAVKRHIDYMLDVEKIESLHLDWFGGEPFMFFNQIVVPISRYAKKRCLETNTPFLNGATTNGYFLTSKVSGQLSELGFGQFQITLDGERQFHDNVKFTSGCQSTFDHVLKNIDQILADNEKLVVYFL